MIRITVNARFRSRPITGVERFASEVCERLSSDSEVEWSEIAPPRPLSGLRGHAWEQWSLPRQLDRDSILFSPCNTGPIGIERQLAVIHDAAVWEVPESFSRAFRTIYQQLLPRLAKRAKAVATVSEYSRERLSHFLGIPEEDIHVLGNAIDPAFCPLPDRPASDPEAPVFLCAGSLDPRKNLPRLVRAWARLHEQGRIPEKARLNIVGGANARSFAHFDRADAPGLHWLGRVSDEELIQHYQTSDAFLFPSLYEGFGLPPLEAMACGCPVLLSDRASLPEVGGETFRTDEPDSTGAVLYFQPDSEENIAAAIHSFLRMTPETKERLRANALQRASTFTWEAVAARTLKAIRTI